MVRVVGEGKFSLPEEFEHVLCPRRPASFGQKTVANRSKLAEIKGDFFAFPPSEVGVQLLLKIRLVALLNGDARRVKFEPKSAARLPRKPPALSQPLQLVFVSLFGPKSEQIRTKVRGANSPPDSHRGVIAVALRNKIRRTFARGVPEVPAAPRVEIDFKNGFDLRKLGLRIRLLTRRHRQ